MAQPAYRDPTTDTWLAEYNQAATEAETYKVAKLSQLNVITKDFLTAVNRVAPMWATSFQDSRRFKSSISRKTTTLKRPLDQEPASTRGAKCPACGQRHSIQDCYY
ncbi:uncharacterized protein M421DRAFT_416153, partial [Didymella exigua CBS 183.55]